MVIMSALGGLAFFCLMIYAMFCARRTVFRVIGWAILLPLFLGFFILRARGWGCVDVSEATKVIGDLRNLKSAALLFYGDNEAWPSPGQEASLDEYSDRPIVNAAPSRYARVILLERPFGEAGSADLYVGVELLPKNIGMKEFQRKLSRRAEDHGLLQEPASGGGGLIPYESGLSVYMQIY